MSYKYVSVHHVSRYWYTEFQLYSSRLQWCSESHLHLRPSHPKPPSLPNRPPHRHLGTPGRRRPPETPVPDTPVAPSIRARWSRRLLPPQPRVPLGAGNDMCQWCANVSVCGSVLSSMMVRSSPNSHFNGLSLSLSLSLSLRRTECPHSTQQTAHEQRTESGVLAPLSPLRRT